MKTFCLDTNVLIHDPRALFAFEENDIVITEYVLLELDKLKEGAEEKNHNARIASRLIRQISTGLSEQIIDTQKSQADLQPHGFPGLPIPGTEGRLILLMDNPDDRVKGETRDDQILGLLHRHRSRFKIPIIVVTKDTLMGIKAIGRGFGHQDYRRDQAQTQLQQISVLDARLIPMESLFSGETKAVKAPGILSKSCRSGDSETPIIPGYYIVVWEEGKELLIHLDHDEQVRVIFQTPNLCRTKNTRGIRAKNLEQNAAVDALLNPLKSLVCLLGPAGTGKTLLAIAAALDQVRKANRKIQAETASGEEDELTRKERKQLRHKMRPPENGAAERMQILIARPMVSMGKEMGFLPGDVEEKMRPWIQPIIDNLKLLLGAEQADSLLEDGTIELQPLQFIRGRSINNAWLIIDEAQNCTPLEIKTIITRAGKDCRVFLTGDPAQIDVPWLDRLSNGLTYAADRMGKESLAAVVPLVKCERSQLAARAAELL
jgi:PhoH-like ATPase